MSETLTAYFASRTGHVLGAVTRAAGTIPSPPRAASAEDVLVRGGFDNPSSGGQSVNRSFPGFLVPATQLSTLVLPPDLGLVLSPLRFQVLAQTDVVQPLTLTVDRLSLSVVPTVKLTVTVSRPVTQAEPVWVLVTGGTLTSPSIAVGSILASTTAGILDLENLADGAYDFLALVRGHRPLGQHFDIDR